MRLIEDFPLADKAAIIKEAEALKSVAITGAELNSFTPLINAVSPLSFILAPNLASS